MLSRVITVFLWDRGWWQSGSQVPLLSQGAFRGVVGPCREGWCGLSKGAGRKSSAGTCSGETFAGRSLRAPVASKINTRPSVHSSGRWMVDSSLLAFSCTWSSGGSDLGSGRFASGRGEGLFSLSDFESRA